MAKVSNEKKLEALKDWLKENNIKFIENHKSQFGVTIDVKIQALRIAIFKSDGKEREDAIYNSSNGKYKLFKFYKPFFVRESETKEFILEKIQTCCFDQMVKMQRRWEKEQRKGK